MNRFRLRFALPVLGLCLAAGLFAGFGAAAPSVFQSKAVVKATTVVVTAGKPSELAFKLSKFSSIPAGTVTFKVTNEGYAYHNFKVCTAPVTSAVKNSCVGKVTKILMHGQSATLTVKFTKNGKYEYLCTEPGHAASGMKGLIGIGVKVAAPVVKKTTTTSTTTKTTTTTTALTGGGQTTTSTTTTTASSGGGNSAAPSGPDGCPGGTTIAQNTPTTGGDGDVDDTGQQSDLDGCI